MRQTYTVIVLQPEDGVCGWYTQKQFTFSEKETTMQEYILAVKNNKKYGRIIIVDNVTGQSDQIIIER
jgi:hypothetical protein